MKKKNEDVRIIDKVIEGESEKDLEEFQSRKF